MDADRGAWRYKRDEAYSHLEKLTNSKKPKKCAADLAAISGNKDQENYECKSNNSISTTTSDGRKDIANHDKLDILLSSLQ